MAAKSRFFSLNLDAVGFSASILCALHCVALPLILTLFAWSGAAYLNDPVIELTVLCLNAVLAVASIIPAFIRQHRNSRPILFVVAGFAFISIGHVELAPVWEALFISIGALLIASGHFVNWLSCKRCKGKRNE